MKKIFYITLCIALIFIGCEEENNPVDPGKQVPTTKIPETTKILSNTDYSNYLVSISSDSTQFTFSSSMTSIYNPKVNDILYIPTSTGLLRKITNIQQVNNQLIISTAQGTFEEAIETGRLSFKTKLRASQINKVTYLTDGVSLTNEILKKVNTDTLIQFSFNKAIFDLDGDTVATTNDQVRLLGYFNLMQDILFDVDVRNFRLEHVRYGYEMNNDLNLTLQANFNYQVNRSIQIARITFNPIYLQIGVLPVVIIPEIFVNLGIKGYANASLLTSIDNQLFVEAGIEYKRASGWGTYQNLMDVFNFNPPQITANAGARGYLAPEVSMAVYGVLAAYARGELYAEIVADLFSNPWWSFYMGLDLGVGARANLLGAQLFNYSKNDLIKFRKQIAQATNTPPPPTPTLSSPSNGATNVAIPPTLSWNVSSGATSYALQVSTNINFTNFAYNQSGITAISRQVTGLNNSTTYYWRVNASNSNSTSDWSTARSFTTTAGGSIPSVPTLSSPSNGATNVAIPPTLIWNASNSATSYTLQVSTNSNFTNFVYNQSGLTATSKQVTGLNNSTVYFWRVNASNSYGTSGWSNYRSFTTVAASGGEIRGNVYDATSNNPITNATVKLKQGGSTLSTKTTNSTGFYSFTNVAPGNYSVEVSKTGYVSDTKNSDVTPGSINTLDFYLSPTSSDVDFRIVLQWGANPSDLDAHLYKGQYHIYYANKGNQFSPPYTVLDIDVTTGYGPETITIYNLNSDECKYYVHRYAGTPGITQSNAVVKVYSGNSLLKTYYVPATGNGDWWYVFDITSAGLIVDKNYIVTNPAKMMELPNKYN